MNLEVVKSLIWCPKLCCSGFQFFFSGESVNIDGR